MPSPEGRSPIAIGFEWASRILVAGISLVVPMLAGIVIDRRVVGLRPLGTLLGVVVGLAVGAIQVVRLARASSAR